MNNSILRLNYIIGTLQTNVNSNWKLLEKSFEGKLKTRVVSKKGHGYTYYQQNLKSTKNNDL